MTEGMHGFTDSSTYGFRNHTPEEIRLKALSLNANVDKKKLNENIRKAYKQEIEQEKNIIKKEIDQLEKALDKINKEIIFYEKRSSKLKDPKQLIIYDEKIFQLEESKEPLEKLLKEQVEEFKNSEQERSVNMDGMEQVEETIENTEAEETVDQTSSMENSEATEQVGQQTDQPATEQEYDYTQDERLKRMWSNEAGELDANKLYKSYRNSEKFLEELKPFKDQHNDLNSKLEERGFSVDKIDDLLGEYSELKDPNNPRNQDLQILQDFMSEPAYEQKIGNFFRELQVERLQQQFPGMNEQQIKETMQMKDELKQLKQAEYERQRDSKTKEYLSLISESTDKMAKFSKDRGFDITDDIKNDVLKHCAENNVPANAIFATFLDKYGDKVFEAQENRMRDNYTKGLSKTDKTKVPTGTKRVASRGTSTSDNKARLRDSISAYLNKNK